jgi:hypothetical protein
MQTYTDAGLHVYISVTLKTWKIEFFSSIVIP